VQAVHPDGEVAVARAAAARGTAIGLSSFASKPIEEVAAANPQTFFQMYWVGTREEMLQRMARAKAAGSVGMIITLDWSFSHGRDWGGPAIPEKMDARAILRFAPEAITRPRWLTNFARTRRIPDLTAPNLSEPGGQAPTFFGAYGQWMQTPRATWEDVAWLREQWDGPFMLKGIMRVDDARRAINAGVTAISVSNHGGNNLDGTPAPIRALAAIVDAVGDAVEVVLDGDIRRGSDVVKALALGARAVMIGRAHLWGLAANGKAGGGERPRHSTQRHRFRGSRSGPQLDSSARPPRPSGPTWIRPWIQHAKWRNDCQHPMAPGPLTPTTAADTQAPPRPAGGDHLLQRGWSCARCSLEGTDNV
jgi:L-lactate dehydrogenase (cytochrome)/glycolate oxidase